MNGKRLQEQGIKKDDPVLYTSLNSFRNKRDIEEEIRTSSKTLGHGSKGIEEVFHRATLPHQLKVINKANAYVEVIITDSCKCKVQGERGTSRNHVQAYLSELTVQQVRDLHRDVQAALDDFTDTNRQMSVYACSRDKDGNNVGGCFHHTPGCTGPVLATKGPYKSTDDNRVLHQRLTVTIPSGLKNYAFIWTAERKKEAPHHPRATRLDRCNGLR